MFEFHATSFFSTVIDQLIEKQLTKQDVQLLSERLRDARKCSESSALVYNFHFSSAVCDFERLTDFSAKSGEYAGNFAEFLREANSGIFKKRLSCGKTDFLSFWLRKRRYFGKKRYRQIFQKSG